MMSHTEDCVLHCSVTLRCVLPRFHNYTTRAFYGNSPHTRNDITSNLEVGQCIIDEEFTFSYSFRAIFLPQGWTDFWKLYYKKQDIVPLCFVYAGCRGQVLCYKHRVVCSDTCSCIIRVLRDVCITLVRR